MVSLIPSPCDDELDTDRHTGTDKDEEMGTDWQDSLQTGTDLDSYNSQRGDWRTQGLQSRVPFWVCSWLMIPRRSILISFLNEIPLHCWWLIAYYCFQINHTIIILIPWASNNFSASVKLWLYKVLNTADSLWLCEKVFHMFLYSSLSRLESVICPIQHQHYHLID